jgi:hypothetical protein
MQATARRLSVVSATSCARRRLIRGVRRFDSQAQYSAFAASDFGLWAIREAHTELRTTGPYHFRTLPFGVQPSPIAAIGVFDDIHCDYRVWESVEFHPSPSADVPVSSTPIFSGFAVMCKHRPASNHALHRIRAPLCAQSLLVIHWFPCAQRPLPARIGELGRSPEK